MQCNSLSSLSEALHTVTFHLVMFLPEYGCIFSELLTDTEETRSFYPMTSEVRRCSKITAL